MCCVYKNSSICVYTTSIRTRNQLESRQRRVVYTKFQLKSLIWARRRVISSQVQKHNHFQVGIKRHMPFEWLWITDWSTTTGIDYLLGSVPMISQMSRSNFDRLGPIWQAWKVHNIPCAITYRVPRWWGTGICFVLAARRWFESLVLRDAILLVSSGLLQTTDMFLSPCEGIQ